jgi:hypothetical protein
MENSLIAKKETIRCINCHQPLITFKAYIPGRGEVCLKYFADNAGKEENL